MNIQSQLRLQAYVDNELSPEESQRVVDWLAADPQARALVAELTQTHAWLNASQPQRKLPVSGDFYWSQIKSAIAPVESRPVREAEPFRLGLGWLWKWAVPVAGMALIILAMLPVNPSRPPSSAFAGGVMEIESALPDSNVITFRSDSEGISVVWMETP
jgi:anti-sigma factor RsiW